MRAGPDCKSARRLRVVSHGTGGVCNVRVAGSVRAVHAVERWAFRFKTIGDGALPAAVGMLPRPEEVLPAGRNAVGCSALL